jgi:hypothetical protein
MGKTWVIVVTATLVLSGCMTNMPPSDVGSRDSPRKVLIASEDTGFKRSVVDRVVGKLGTQDWYFHIIGLDSLAAQDTAPYGAVLVLAHLWGGKIDERAMGYVRTDPANPKVILFTTRGAETPLPESLRPDLPVDAVSSASRADRVDTRAEELAALIAKRF